MDLKLAFDRGAYSAASAGFTEDLSLMRFLLGARFWSKPRPEQSLNW